MGELSILNVGSGDTKISFDRSNPAECIRAGRIVKDMLRRGYALLVEVERDGEKKFERALDFDEKTSEYIIADFDQLTAHDHDMQERANRDRQQGAVKPNISLPEAVMTGDYPNGESITEQADVQEATGEKVQGGSRRGPRGNYRKRVPASGARAVSVGRSAGG